MNTTATTIVLNGGFKYASSLKVGDKIQVLSHPAAKPEKPANPPAQKPTEKPARIIEAWGVNSALTEQESRRIGAERKLDSEQALRLAAERRLNDFAATLNVPPGYTAFPIQAQPGYNATATVLYNPVSYTHLTLPTT